MKQKSPAEQVEQSSSCSAGQARRSGALLLWLGVLGDLLLPKGEVFVLRGEEGEGNVPVFRIHIRKTLLDALAARVRKVQNAAAIGRTSSTVHLDHQIDEPLRLFTRVGRGRSQGHGDRDQTLVFLVSEARAIQ